MRTHARRCGGITWASSRRCWRQAATWTLRMGSRAGESSGGHPCRWRLWLLTCIAIPLTAAVA